MTRLADFLKEQAAEQRRTAPEMEQKRKEWVAAVERLIEQMENWLRQADSEMILRVERIRVEMLEEGLGEYAVPGLSIKLGTQRVEVLPRARNVAGAILLEDGKTYRPQGRVDLTSGGVPFVLYRVIRDQGDQWFLFPLQADKAKPFDNEAFEAILLGLLR
jgi:hypothetical protein